MQCEAHKPKTKITEKESGPFVCVGCLIKKGATPEATTWYDYTVRAMTNMTESLTHHETPDLPREDLFYRR
jgi:hypothetical protein